MSSISFKKLTKNQLIFLEDIYQMLNRLKALNILVSLFFGERGLLDQGLSRIIKKFEGSKQILRVKKHTNQLFIAKVMYAINERIYFWLQECMISISNTKTNMESTMFLNIFTSIQMGNFYHFLPPTVIKQRKV